MTPHPLAQALSQQETLDIRRISGKAPCAECKRLKLKCDKIIPCASCVRRGCGDTCPNGTYLPTGRGRRTVPTEASRLRRMFSDMEARMKELETAITRANNYHLDVCPYLGISPGDKDPAAEQLADSLGALSINDTGDAQYYGPSAGTEALLSAEVSDDLDVEEIPSTFTAITDSFPLGFRDTTTWDPDHAVVELLAHLPAKSRAWALVDLYFENGCWSGTPIMRDELLELLYLVYGTSANGSGAALPRTCSVHQLAVIYGVFALGALVDLSLPPYNAESGHYFDLCRAALSVLSVFENPSTSTVQALVLLSVFYSHGGPRFSMAGAWSVISLASNLCKTMGLHTGRAQPGVASKQIQRNRALFWETYAIETLQSLAVGRPTGTYLAAISCPFPLDEEQSMDDAGSILPGFYHRRWQFIKQIAAPILETYLSVQAPSYDVIVELDQRIRKFMHSAMCTNPTPEDDRSSPATYFQRRAIREACMIMLVYIHNHAFVSAMCENPEDSYYTSRATSYLSACRYASEIIRENIDNFRRHSQLFSRWWPTWKNLFNAAMIVGAIAAKTPQAHYAPRALLELFVAIDLFEGGAATSNRARGALKVLHKLRAKAMAAYTKYSHSAGPGGLDPADADTDATLDVFAGRTRIVAQTILARDRCVPIVPNIYPAAVFPGPDATLMESTLDEGNGPRHGTLSPTLVEYFSSSSARLDFEAEAPSEHVPVELAGVSLFELGARPPAVLDPRSWASVPGSVTESDSLNPFSLDTPHDSQWMDFLQDL